MSGYDNLNEWQELLHRRAGLGELEQLELELRATPATPFVRARLSVVLRRMGREAESQAVLEEDPSLLCRAQHTLHRMASDPALRETDLPELAPPGQAEAQLRLDTIHGMIAARNGSNDTAERYLNFAWRLARAMGAERYVKQLEMSIIELRGAHTDDAVSAAHAKLLEIARGQEPDPEGMGRRARMLTEVRLLRGETTSVELLLEMLSPEDRQEIGLLRRAIRDDEVEAQLLPPSELRDYAAHAQLLRRALWAAAEGDAARARQIAEQVLSAPRHAPRDLYGSWRSGTHSAASRILGRFEESEQHLEAMQRDGAAVNRLYAAALGIELDVAAGRLIRPAWNEQAHAALARLGIGEAAASAAEVLATYTPHAVVHLSRTLDSLHLADAATRLVRVVQRGTEPSGSRAYQRSLNAKGRGGVAFLQRIKS